jgi:hypothetical protein
VIGYSFRRVAVESVGEQNAGAGELTECEPLAVCGGGVFDSGGECAEE